MRTNYPPSSIRCPTDGRYENCKNRYGHSVHKYCASCEFKEVLETGTRWCKVHDTQIDPHDVCDEWTMSHHLTKVGGTWGVVKDKTTKEIIII